MKSEPAWEPVHAEAVRRIHRALRPSGGRLVFAVGAARTLRERLVEELQQAGGLPVRAVELDRDVVDPWADLQGGADAICVVGIPPDAGSALFQRLNLGREGVSRRGLRVVLWLSRLDQMELLRTTAPDLWAHRVAFFPFISIADLPVGDLPTPRPIGDQLREVEARLAAWRGSDKAGQMVWMGRRIMLLFEAGRVEEARLESGRLEERAKRAGPADRWASRRALARSRLRMSDGEGPHSALASTGAMEKNPDEHVRLLARTRRLGSLGNLGHLDRLAKELESDVELSPSSGRDSAHRVNRALRRLQLTQELGDFDAVNRWLEDGEREAAARPDFEAESARLHIMFKMAEADRLHQQGHWLDALQVVHRAAHLSGESGTSELLALLRQGANIACTAGLSELGRNWSTETLRLSRSGGPILKAQSLTVALSDPADPSAANHLAAARALLSQLHDRSAECDLLCALGLNSDAEAEARLHSLARRHGYDGYLASRALFDLYSESNEGAQAAVAARGALPYAEKHGGFALKAEIHLDIALGCRQAGDEAGQAAALAAADRELATVSTTLHPYKLLCNRAGIAASLAQGRGDLAQAEEVFRTILRYLRERGLRLAELETLVGACRFGGIARRGFGEEASLMAIELGLPLFEARATLELCALSAEEGRPDLAGFNGARSWLEQIGSRSDRRRLAEVQAMVERVPALT